MGLINFKKGLKTTLPAIGLRDPETFYITTDEGTIYLGNNKWVTASSIGNPIKYIEPSIVAKKLILTLTYSNNTTEEIVLLNAISGSNSDIVYNSNGDFTVNVVLSPTANNIIKSNSGGLFASVRPVYDNATGNLKIQYTSDGTSWTNLPGTTNIPLDSFLTEGIYIPTQTYWNDNYKGVYGDATISVPSLVLVVKTSAEENIYNNIVVPVTEMGLKYTVKAGNQAIRFTTSTVGSVVTITGYVNISSDGNNILKLSDSGDGLTVAINTTPTKGNINLTNTVDGLGASFEWGYF